MRDQNVECRVQGDLTVVERDDRSIEAPRACQQERNKKVRQCAMFSKPPDTTLRAA
jgi:hypothetical protein